MLPGCRAQALPACLTCRGLSSRLRWRDKPTPVVFMQRWYEITSACSLRGSSVWVCIRSLGWTHATVITHHPRADPRQPGMVQLTVTQQASPSVILSHLSLHCHLSYSCFSFPSFSPSPQGLKIGLEKENLETYDPKYAFYPNFLMDLLGNGSYFTKS